MRDQFCADTKSESVRIVLQCAEERKGGLLGGYGSPGLLSFSGVSCAVQRSGRTQHPKSPLRSDLGWVNRFGSTFPPAAAVLVLV
jgi:hypothetical protein